MCKSFTKESLPGTEFSKKHNKIIRKCSVSLTYMFDKELWEFFMVIKAFFQFPHKEAVKIKGINDISN